MFSHRSFFVFLSAATVVGGFVIFQASRSSNALPDDLDQVDPSAEFLNAEASIAYYREAIRRNPRAVEERVRLAQVLMQQARTTARGPEFIPEARRLLQEALQIDPDHYYGLTLQASLFNALHRFEEARELSERMIAAYPQHAFTMGTLVDALVELGEYDRAVEVADAMLALRPGLPSYSRASYLRELHGDVDGAIEAMQMAADSEAGGVESRAWALYELGKLYLGTARPDTAAFIFEGILAERPGFAPALEGLGHVALASGDVDDAIARLEQARALQPRESTDELLMEAYGIAGEERRADAAARRILQSLEWAREMGEIVDMEEADLLADLGQDLPRALELARRQVARRPTHLHANETMAWTLFRNGRADAAIPYIERAMRLGTGDAMVHYRAARIYEAVGRTSASLEHLRLAQAGHLHVESPSAAREVEERLELADRGRTPVQTTTAY